MDELRRYVWEKESLWLLFERQSRQEKVFETKSDIGKANLEKIALRIWAEGWPSLECQSENEVLTEGVAKNEAAETIDHSYSSLFVCPWSNHTPEVGSFTWKWDGKNFNWNLVIIAELVGDQMLRWTTWSPKNLN